MAYKTQEELEHENQNFALVLTVSSALSAIGAFFLRKGRSPNARELKEVATALGVITGIAAAGVEVLSSTLAQLDHDAQAEVKAGLKLPAKLRRSELG